MNPREATIIANIAQMQGELNQLVGIDTLAFAAGKGSAVTIQAWTRRYMDQLAGEAMECRDNFYHKWWSKEVKDGTVSLYTLRSREKVLVELIDMLHFYVSALQCLGYPSAWEALWDGVGTPKLTTDVDAYGMVMVIAGSSLAKAPHFHMISKGFAGLFRYFNLTLDDVFDIYAKKHAANVKRQHDGYSVDTKTEADNEAIEESLRKGKT